MSVRGIRKLLVVAASSFALASFLVVPLSAERWLPLDAYVKHCVLIVKCRTELQDDRLAYKVVETWKGEYNPDLFYHRPPDGYLFTNTWHGNEKPTDGRETIFFFTDNNIPSWAKGKLIQHSTAFPVTNGKVVYASTNFNLRKEYAVEDFKKEILRIVAAHEGGVKYMPSDPGPSQEHAGKVRVLPDRRRDGGTTTLVVVLGAGFFAATVIVALALRRRRRITTERES